MRAPRRATTIMHQKVFTNVAVHAAILVGMIFATAARGEASVVWHGSLAAAKTASATSHRPVLVIFTAAWSEASDRFIQTTLATPEASGLVSACFEAVRLDVDSHSELAKKLGVSHMPTACIIDQNDQLLARFDCSESAAEFVSNAGRAIQTAAEVKLAANPSAAAAPPAATPTAEPASALMPPTPPSWPAESGTNPTDSTASPRPALSAFSGGSAASVFQSAPPAVPPTTSGRATVEPQPSPRASPQPSAPWLGQPTATPPAAPQPTMAIAPPAAPPAAYSTTPLQTPPTAGQPASGMAATPAPPTAVPSTKPADEKPKSTNPFVAFFQDPAAAFKLPSFELPSFTKKDDIPKPSTSATPQPASPRPQPTAATTAAATTTTAADPYGTMPVGLEGYCPVTLVEKNVWVEGRPQWGARHRGRTYLFAGQAEQQAFLSAPDRYAPALSGDDPVLALDAGRQVPGQRRYGVTYQSRIYLFSSPETRHTFTITPEKYTGRVAIAENPQRPAPGTVVR